MVAVGRRHSISAAVVAVSGCRRRLPALAAGVPDLLRVLVLVEILLLVVPFALTSKFLNISFTLSCVAMRFQTGFLLIRAHACASTSP